MRRTVIKSLRLVRRVMYGHTGTREEEVLIVLLYHILWGLQMAFMAPKLGRSRYGFQFKLLHGVCDEEQTARGDAECVMASDA